MNGNVQRAVNETRALLERDYGDRLAQLVLFGSHARGDAVLGSDIDLLVVLHGDVDSGAEASRVGRALSEISLRHDVVVSCVFMAENRYRNERSPFLLNIRREGIAA